MGIIEWMLLFIVFAFLVSRFMPVKGVKNISVQEAKAKFKEKGIQFIDVRTPGEYKSNHRKPFHNIPLSNLSSQIDKLDKEKEIVVICQSGMRSAKAAKTLKKHGFHQIYNVKGGMSAWM
ncbi:rhodanese-like domain-containing protein [Cytobacillus gottheilii]|uniref:rhodanese-like domain-containing protein n=1 Tax=Cytobacillus gottheilii TaxID=859144 RepID=UPI0009BB22AC|nr:rhodanese-like domain-containing protein [Cytobacillus gottheilii]